MPVRDMLQSMRLLALCLLVGCYDAKVPDCSYACAATSEDCPGDQSCVLGLCRDPGAPPACPASSGDAAVGVCGNDSTLVACYTFDGDTKDRSGNNHDADATSVGFAPGMSQQAVTTTTASRISVLDHPDFNLLHFTLQTWVNPTMLPPTGARMGIIDSSEYALFITAGGGIQCIGAADIVIGGIVVDTWTHVACTYNGQVQTLYIDGMPRTQQTTTFLIVPTAAELRIAANGPDGAEELVGALDELRVYREARTAAQICGDAGRTFAGTCQ